ncbi:uracil-DNA glycosylase, family 4 [Thioflavicoccus mobilis 8321]|uniref:Type-4 uracil-DNA glycosylase n=1 Tax=Thioflavicoccus mobilis 8321 TaxID=765912 RepID=L0H1X0_9GAMM|nr:uracil-DNA glycosylase, family 4 [Thioflavicoccus mobilis 8321]
MDAERRFRYLAAMGVPLWQRRDLPPRPPAERPSAPPERPRSQPVAGAGPETPPPAPPATPPGGGRTGEIVTLDWDGLRRAVAGCRACTLCETRTQTVFGVGSPHADLMLIGEAPGADEDRAGEPFVGRAGQLLNRMLQAIGLEREQVFIANILKCRPPGNRDPRSEEAAYCEPFLLRQIALLSPKVILALGRVSAQGLLRTDASIGRLRGRWHRFADAGVPLYVTYHPAYLLRTPAQKAAAWQDLQAVRRRLSQPIAPAGRE